MCTDLLIKDLEMHLLAGEFGCDLTQMQGGPCEPIKPGDDEGVAFAHIFQARLELGPGTRRPTLLFLEQFVTLGQFVHLNHETLAYRTNPCIADECHMPFLLSQNL
jgi:hypothetical protein